MQSVASATSPADRQPHVPPAIEVQGKFFFTSGKKHFVKGVTYGPFAPGADGTQFPEPARVAQDFALMAEMGANTARVFTVPPVWLLDIAGANGLKVLVGIPWSQHITFLDNPAVQAEIRRSVLAGVRSCERHHAVFAYLIGNEIPPDMVRWHGAERVREFLKDLVAEV